METLFTGEIYYQGKPSLRYTVSELEPGIRPDSPYYVEIRSLTGNHVVSNFMPLDEVTKFLSEHREY